MLEASEVCERLGLNGEQGQWDISTDLLTLEQLTWTSLPQVHAHALIKSPEAAHGVNFLGESTTSTCYIHYSSSVLELATTNNEYSLKLASGKTAEKTLRKLAWNVDDLSRLNDSRKMRIE